MIPTVHGTELINNNDEDPSPEYELNTEEHTGIYSTDLEQI